MFIREEEPLVVLGTRAVTLQIDLFFMIGKLCIRSLAARAAMEGENSGMEKHCGLWPCRFWQVYNSGMKTLCEIQCCLL